LCGKLELWIKKKMKIAAEYCEVIFTVCGKNSGLAKILPKQHMIYHANIPNNSRFHVY
jgi:hypothetical protein